MAGRIGLYILLLALSGCVNLIRAIPHTTEHAATQPSLIGGKLALTKVGKLTNQSQQSVSSVFIYCAAVNFNIFSILLRC